MTALDTGLVLTRRQREVVEQPWDARTLVTAGAGAGKTTTLTHRLEHLTRAEDLSTSEILVLSFSRAAVRELRDRVDRLATTARSVRAQTFDGWALAVLRQMHPDRDDLAGTTFDDRIAMATEAIKENVLDGFEYGPPAHVVIDEVQDLVGVRRRMVETLLMEYADNCGFTVVGDAAQSIYGFQIDDAEERAHESNRFFRWVRHTFADDLVEIDLDENFRARTDEARIALPLGRRLQSLPMERRAASAAAAQVLGELWELLERTPDFGDLTDPFVLDSLALTGTTTAILCRDNGQVLWLSDRLQRAGVAHGIQRSLRARPVPAWISELLHRGGDAVIDEQRFAMIAEALPSLGDDPARVWRSLRRIGSAPRNRLDLGALRRALGEGRLPDELSVQQKPELLLSTIHRAKGLEFDRVIIAAGLPRDREPDYPEEARLLYVAMTRARDDLYRIVLPEWRRMHKGDHLAFRVDRWYLGGYKKFARNGIEALETDVDHELPAGMGVRAPDIQWYLRAGVGLGDEVTLRLLDEPPPSDTESPPYEILHGGRMIGRVSAGFRKDVFRLLKVSRTWDVRRYPREITGFRIDALETVMGSHAVGARAGLGDSGTWVAPRLSGLGRFDWGGDPSESEAEA